MTAKDSSVTAAAAGLAEAVAARYALGAVAPLEPLTGGIANDVFAAETDAGRVVVRVKHPPIRLASLRWEHAVVGALADRLDEVDAPLGARDGSSFFLADGHAVSVFPFAPGSPARVRADAAEAGRVLGRLHGAAAGLDLRPRPEHERLSDLPFPQIGGFPAEAGIDVARLRTLRAWAVDFVRELETGRRLTEGLVHGDFFPGNLLIDAGRASAVLDWEEAHLDWQAFDLAHAAWDFCKDASGTAYDRGSLARFLTAYDDAGGTVPAGERDLLVPFTRVKRILEVLRAPTDRVVDWRYQRENLAAADALS